MSTATITIAAEFTLPADGELSDRLDRLYDVIGQAVRKELGGLRSIGPPAVPEPALCSGMVCPVCRIGQLRIWESRSHKRSVFQRVILKCKNCGHKIEPIDIPREQIVHRKKRSPDSSA